MSESKNLLEVKHLKQYFDVPNGFMSTLKLKAVDDVTFDIKEGETLGMVGESGCGKTTVGRTILHLYKPTDGEVWFDGQLIKDKKSIADFRKKAQMVFQDPYSSLDPRMTVSDIIGEPLDVHKLYQNKKEREEKIQYLMDLVGLPNEHATRYAHEFSGGQRQRIGIARALAVDPKFIVCDEPVSALDVSIQAQVVNMFEDLQKKLGLTYLFIAHDLSIVRFISDRIGVIYKGDIVEVADAEELFDFPLHPYTRSLISAIPIPDPQLEKNKVLFTYDGSCHDYSVNKPSLVDIGHNHLVFGNEDEIAEYKKIRESGVAPKSITIVDPKAKTKKKPVVEQPAIEEEEVALGESILDVPVHDTGSVLYTIIGFFLPLIGLIMFLLFKHFKYYRSYKSSKKGTIYGCILYGSIIGFWLICLILALII